ncbi:MAG: hypothetical protein LBG27_12385 [Spirochaetaceae bacterium]|nr:hypothetical protein [Spirochaetaceae bacterium]
MKKELFVPFLGCLVSGRMADGRRGGGYTGPSSVRKVSEVKKSAHDSVVGKGQSKALWATRNTCSATGRTRYPLN